MWGKPRTFGWSSRGSSPFASVSAYETCDDSSLGSSGGTMNTFIRPSATNATTTPSTPRRVRFEIATTGGMMQDGPSRSAGRPVVRGAAHAPAASDRGPHRAARSGVAGGEPLADRAGHAALIERHGAALAGAARHP